MTEPWYQEAAEQYIEKLARVLEASAPTRRLLDSVFGDFLATVEAPAPEPTLYPFFLHSAILRDLASELSYPFGPELSQRISAIVPLHRVEGTSVRVRHLGLPGLYPNADFRSGSALYIIRSGVPVLITKNSHRYEALWSGGSELDNWTRHETRLATALSCTEYGGFSMYLTHDMRNFPMECLEHVNVDQRVDFMLAYVGLCSAIRQHYRYAYLRPSHEHVGRFQYGDFRPHEKLARRFAAAFLISHPLLLRTARHFLRGSMLWRTDAFTEDALAHIMFALEGCLLLLQDTAGLPTDRLGRRALRNIFADTFADGQALYDFIDEAMGWGGTRARIIHPQLSLEEGWTPFLSADEYYDYCQIVRVLITYLVTGDSFGDYPLAP